MSCADIGIYFNAIATDSVKRWLEVRAVRLTAANVTLA